MRLRRSAVRAERTVMRARTSRSELRLDAQIGGSLRGLPELAVTQRDVQIADRAEPRHALPGVRRRRRPECQPVRRPNTKAPTGRRGLISHAPYAADERVLLAQRRCIFMQADLSLIASNPDRQDSRTAQGAMVSAHVAVRRANSLSAGVRLCRAERGFLRAEADDVGGNAGLRSRP